jgi:UDP:flavonoid glycosyltransferase YjiC (YdhE family)
MNVGILCASIGFGGAQNTTASLASELSRQGHDVTLYIDESRFRSLEDVGHLRVVDLPRDSLLSALWGYCPLRHLI